VRKIAIKWACALLCLGVATTKAQLPPGFADELAVPNPWFLGVGVGFAPAGGVASGRIFVWDKYGRVWNVENGVTSAQPLIDLHEEVGDWRDHGLLGFAVDPNFSTNGYIYLLYVVDFHHLKYFGTAAYDPATNEYFRDTIGRVTRYTCNAADGFRSVDLSSRKVLLGESMSTGLPMCHQSHGVGALVFGSDGTLLISCGDGASYERMDNGGPQSGSSNTALADGIIRPAEDVGAFRAQLLDSHSGKILRIDAATGDGLPSNPYYDPTAPRAPRSRVYSLGMRNPFRFSLRPGTGSLNPADGNPGVLYVGNVGWSDFEELNVCDAPGQNFGWPLYEGMNTLAEYVEGSPQNLDMPNPLFGTAGCTRPYFSFSDLIVQDTKAPNPSFPNPCDPTKQISASVRKFVHHRPVLDWAQSVKTQSSFYVGNNSNYLDIGVPGSPVQGEPAVAFSITGGVWYTGTQYPTQFQNTYVAADFVTGWMKSIVMGPEERPTAVQNFMAAGSAAVSMATDPISGDLFYLDFDSFGDARLRRIRYVAGNNQPPVAVASATPTSGNSPLTVQFTGSLSSDPEGAPLTYRWDFGDGLPPSTLANPVHTYTNDEDISALGTIVARVDNLTPPGPQGGGNYNREILRDGVYPPVGSSDWSLQFDTFHFGDQGTNDWVGYTFPTKRTITGVIFQEGNQFGDGGWLDTLNLQPRVNGIFGNRAYTSTPAYAGANGVTFETYVLRLNTPVLADGIRIQGDPGGSKSFFSLAELRVLAAPTQVVPLCRTAKLTVTDDVGLISTTTVAVSLNNTPPNVAITSPLDGSVYPIFRSLTIPLTATVSDAEFAANQLSCRWQVILHHNAHTHPESPDFNCSTSARLDPHGTLGDTFFYEIRLTVTDPGCLSTTRTVFVRPNPCRADFDNNGFVTGDDFDEYVAAFESGSIDADVDFNGFVNGDDFDAFVSEFVSGCP